MDKNKRRLTKQELNRKACFEKINSDMRQQGYEAKNMIIDIRKANCLSPLAVLPFMILIFFVYYNVNGFHLEELSVGFALLAFLLIVCLIIVHELIHGITWGIFAKKHFHSINFGIIWSSVSPYCTCSEPLRKWQYLLGVAMPTLILGGGVAVVAVVTNQLLLFFLSEFMILSGGGDFLIALKLLLYRTSKKENVYYDHPYEYGFVIFEK